MRLDDLDPTDNARDLGSGGGGGGGLPLFGLIFALFGRRLGCGGLLLVAAVLVLFTMMNNGNLGLPVDRSGEGPGTGQTSTEGGGQGVCNTPERLEACRVMRSTEITWGQIFQREGKRYTPATINFFQGGVDTGCGSASSAVGPFYCPGDDGVYLDTSFFAELDKRFGAKGDFARAYVIAHEVGHHIQDLLGTSEQVSGMQQRGSREQGNAWSVRLELQADCYAGVWAFHNRDRIEPGDIEEGMTAANAIGDDTLQQEAQGRVTPENFTHGTSAQRMKWLRTGLESGDPDKCDTFSGEI
ncbi:neutral zinc metallopeptidase [Sphingomonas sp. LB-2]|uniref:KPN_02809 family neutral zinc metallopeptidase n=1 Tax=Sphingomonas caeni TaxID=2984949 RepID=UPI00222EA4AA|nr:neutral zinc metallopeptidase [Sphingomonas caeni]MCW3848565.1 neutral zinc metallopeptidase [Sphingomonas caeni]